MIFAFACHVVAVILTVFATGYPMLYVGTFVAALGNGTLDLVGGRGNAPTEARREHQPIPVGRGEQFGHLLTPDRAMPLRKTRWAKKKMSSGMARASSAPAWMRCGEVSNRLLKICRPTAIGCRSRRVER